MVGQHDRDGVAAAQAERVQPARDRASVLEELAVGEHPTVGVDNRGAIGIGGRDAPEAEPGAVHEKRDYCFSEMADEFRDQLRARFAEHHPGPPPKGREARLEWQRAWCATAVDHELAGPSWPREYGGMDLTFEEQVVYAEEVARARVPGVPGTGVGIAGPTVIRYGTEEQKLRLLRPMLRADVIWAQGYSEPEAGSDLPALRTTAVRDGDRYVVHGQKVWSSSADIADILFSLVRTGGPDSGRDGITYLLIDAHAPGVTVRPLRDMTGDSGFCEIFLDGVEVAGREPHRRGERGWDITRTSLGHERAAGALTQARFYDRIVRELAALARACGRADDPIVRQRLARLRRRPADHVAERGAHDRHHRAARASRGRDRRRPVSSTRSSSSSCTSSPSICSGPPACSIDAIHTPSSAAGGRGASCAPGPRPSGPGPPRSSATPSPSASSGSRTTPDP